MINIKIKDIVKIFLISLFPFLFIINQIDATLSATTANVINGYSPRFIKAIEDDMKTDKPFKYFGVVYNGNPYFTAKELNVALGNNISTKTPNSLKFSSTLLAPDESEFVDSDGDSQVSLAEIKTNPINIDWFYENSDEKEIKLTLAQKNQTFSTLINNGIYPYFKIWGDVELRTKYGVPNSQKYPDNSAEITGIPYKIFNVQVGGEAIKYASPNMSYATGSYTYGDKTKFDPTLSNGFVPQDDYQNNFPTTGANGLYFYLVTEGINNSLPSTEWSVKTSNADDNSPNAITASVTKTVAPGTSGFKAYNAKNMVLVKLKGPDANSKVVDSAQAHTPILPVDIEITAQTKQNVVLKYKFRIKKWFINRGININNYDVQQYWCAGLGDYKLATIKELSNATNKNLTNYPSNKTNFYKRAVNEGFITEWGRMASYTGADFYNTTYGWGNTVSGATGNQFYFNLNDAAINDDRTKNENYYALCASN